MKNLGYRGRPIGGGSAGDRDLAWGPARGGGDDRSGDGRRRSELSAGFAPYPRRYLS